MKNTPVNIAVCNQKGGIGKSTFTVLLASYLHYVVGHDTLVVDCDYPQWSIHAQRERELAAIEKNDFYKLLMVRQYKQTGRKIWPIVRCLPTETAEAVTNYVEENDYHPRIVFYDLPGTVNAEGIIKILSEQDYLFVPMKADKVVMESTLSFANILHKHLVQNGAFRLKALYLFWTMIDRRERTPFSSNMKPSYGNSVSHCCKRISRIARSSIRNCSRRAKVSDAPRFWPLKKDLSATPESKRWLKRYWQSSNSNKIWPNRKK